MIDVSVVVNAASLAAGKIKWYGEAGLQLTKYSFNKFIDNVDKEKMREYASNVVVICRNNLAEVRCTTRFYLRPNNLDMLLKKICDQIIIQDRSELKMVLYGRQLHVTIAYNKLNDKYRTQDECFNNLLAKIIWYELDQQYALAQIYLPKPDPTLQKWNQRVNEKELVKKLGSQTDWNIFGDEIGTDAIENEEYPKVYEEKDFECKKTQRMKENVKQTPCIDHIQKAEELKRLPMVTNNSFLTNDLRQSLLNPESTRQKKKTGVINSIKKIFKSDKSTAHSRPNNSKQELLLEKFAKSSDDPNNDVEKKMRQSKMYKDDSSFLKEIADIERTRGIADKQISAAVADDTENNSLMIHIPTNVQKIVLIKDGHKIKLEI